MLCFQGDLDSFDHMVVALTTNKEQQHLCYEQDAGKAECLKGMLW